VVTDGVVDIRGGKALHIHCLGEGAPIVVLDAGLGNDGNVWNDVLPEMAKVTRTCAYDRVGMGYSSRPAARPHTNRQMAGGLRVLIERAGLHGPYVVVGHSLGGVNVRLFASEHLAEVAGMVLVDAVGDEQPARLWKDDAPPGTPAEQSAKTLRVWQEMQGETLTLSTNAVQIVATKSGHYIQLAAPRPVVAGVREVVEASRAGRRVSKEALEPLAGEGPERRPFDVSRRSPSPCCFRRS
jgi:hypothetical protein